MGGGVSIVDMSRADSDALVEELMEHSIQPQFRYDHAWRQGDLVTSALGGRDRDERVIDSLEPFLQRAGREAAF